MIKESVGQRGKTAEKEVKKCLDTLNGMSRFAYWRLADARAAGGRLAAQPGDFGYFSNGTGGILEVKSTEHDYRITKDAVSQLPTLNKLTIAGARCFVIILHKGLDKWRIVDTVTLNIGAPSWDLRKEPLFDSAAEALKSTGVF